MTGPVVRVQRRYAHAPERVFDAFLDPRTAGRFLFRTDGGELIRCEVEPRVGGRFTITERRGEEAAEHLGEFVQIDRPRRLVFLFGTQGWDGDFDEITIDIAPVAEGCELTLTHPMKPQWADWRERVTNGWSHMLEGLARALG